MIQKRMQYVGVCFFTVVCFVGAQSLSRGNLDILIVTLWYVYLCQTWNIIGGLAGQFSLAHPVYVALGGYTSTMLFINFDTTPWIGMFAGAFAAMLLASILCWINFRQRLPMLTFALITLAVTMTATIIIETSVALGGHEGLVVPRGASAWKFQFVSPESYYYVILAAVVAMIVFTSILRRSSFGIKLIAIRDNPDAAQMIGISVLRESWIASILSAGLAALAGTFYAQYLNLVDPSISDILLAVNVLLMTAVGGLGTVWGPVFGPLLLVPAERYLGRWFVEYSGVGELFYGIVIITVLLVLKEGIITWVVEKLHLGRSTEP